METTELAVPEQKTQARSVSPAKKAPQGLLYAPIKPWQTRIICLHPAEKAQPLHASLHRAVLIHASIEGILLSSSNELVIYEALSYTWGKPDAKKPLTLNNVAVGITANLHDALIDLRDSLRPRWLWCDALCINQSDLDEKAMQVPNMYAIYQKAARVIVWLGISSERGRMAAQWLKTISSDNGDSVESEAILGPCSSQIKPDDVLTYKRHARYAVPGKLMGRDPESDGEEPPFLPPEQLYRSTAILHGLEEICKCAWMKRIWVVQEVHAARSIEVLCASVAMKWSDFTSLDKAFDALRWTVARLSDRYLESIHDEVSLSVPVLDTIRGSWIYNTFGPPNRSDAADEGLQAIDTISSVSLSRLPVSLTREVSIAGLEPHVKLLELIEHFQHSEASLPHDKIYALLTMASVKVNGSSSSAAISDGIDIDYRISLRELFTRTTTYLIQRSASIELLVSNTKMNKIHIPSWIRDFRYSSLQNVNYRSLFEDVPEKSRALSISDHCIFASGSILGEIVDSTELIFVKKASISKPCDSSRLRQVYLTIPPTLIASPLETKPLYVTLETDNTPGATVWIATDHACISDIVVKLDGGACPLVLRWRAPHGHIFVGGVRPLIAGQQSISGSQKGAIRVTSKQFEGYYDIRRDLKWDRLPTREFQIF